MMLKIGQSKKGGKPDLRVEYQGMQVQDTE